MIISLWRVKKTTTHTHQNRAHQFKSVFSTLNYSRVKTVPAYCAAGDLNNFIFALNWMTACVCVSHPSICALDFFVCLFAASAQVWYSVLNARIYLLWGTAQSAQWWHAFDIAFPISRARPRSAHSFAFNLCRAEEMYRNILYIIYVYLVALD